MAVWSASYASIRCSVAVITRCEARDGRLRARPTAVRWRRSAGSRKDGPLSKDWMRVTKSSRHARNALVVSTAKTVLAGLTVMDAHAASMVTNVHAVSTVMVASRVALRKVGVT